MYVCVTGNDLPLSTILIFDLGIVSFVWYLSDETIPKSNKYLTDETIPKSSKYHTDETIGICLI
jgi:hypothetical protein